LVALTLDGLAAEENLIWIVALAATFVAPAAGVIEVTEKAGGGGGLIETVLLPLPQPVMSAQDKAAVATRKQKRNFVRSIIDTTAC
jgi:hypothetical protein